MFLLPNDCKGECIIKNLYLNSKISSYICVCPYKHTNHIAQKNVEEHLNTNLTGNILERTTNTFLFLFLLFFSYFTLFCDFCDFCTEKCVFTIFWVSVFQLAFFNQLKKLHCDFYMWLQSAKAIRQSPFCIH